MIIVHRCWLGQALAEAAAQVDDRDDDAAQAEHAAHVFRLLRQMRDVRPAFDLAQRHDVDAVLLVADAEADDWICAAAFCAPPAGPG
jgi:hypothetical protein